jgi:hypothetical protein
MMTVYLLVQDSTRAILSYRSAMVAMLILTSG